jgi:hypothetical protein
VLGLSLEITLLNYAKNGISPSGASRRSVGSIALFTLPWEGKVGSLRRLRDGVGWRSG